MERVRVVQKKRDGGVDFEDEANEDTVGGGDKSGRQPHKEARHGFETKLQLGI